MARNHRLDATLDLTPEDVYELEAGHKYHRLAGAHPADFRQAWQAIGQALTAEHAARLPGSRPHAWWIYVAPERRRQIDPGAVHSMLQLGSRVVQKFFYGAPGTHSAADQNCVFECQCEFLQRHHLLLPGEATMACAACVYSGFGQPHLTFQQVQVWYEGAYRAC